MHRWHGLVDGASDGVVMTYKVTLSGVPLDADDGARIDARLSDAPALAQHVHDALVFGAQLGAGQRWRPDRDARVNVLHVERDARSTRAERLVLAADSTLGLAALEQRLLELFAGDRLIEPAVELLQR